MRLTRTPPPFLPLMAGLVLFAWMSLWAWSRSPYARYINHGSWSDGTLLEFCRTLPAGEVLAPALLYVAGWVLMIAAMMLPTTVPLLQVVRGLARERADAGRLLGLVVVGYIVVWLGFGFVAHGADALVHAIADRHPWVALNAWAPGAAVLGIAGAFQFSDMKRRCLDQCRTPLSFALQYWRGHAYARNAFRLGVHHGLYCVGCCWALMLIMFVVGTANIGWMVVLGAVMAAEKNLPWGRRLSAPLGVLLLAVAAVIVGANVL